MHNNNAHINDILSLGLCFEEGGFVFFFPDVLTARYLMIAVLCSLVRVL